MFFGADYFQGKNGSQKYVREPALFKNEDKFVTDQHYSFCFGKDLLQDIGDLLLYLNMFKG